MPVRRIGVVPSGLAKCRLHLGLRSKEYKIQQIGIDILLGRHTPRKLFDELIHDEFIHLLRLRLSIRRRFAFTTRNHRRRRNITCRPQMHIGTGRIINLRLRKDRKDHLIRNQNRIRVGVPRRQMNQPAVDATLKSVRTQHALDHSLADSLAGIHHLFNSRIQRNAFIRPGYGAIEFKLQRRRLMRNAESHLAFALNLAFDRRPHRKQHVILASQVLHKYRVNRIAPLRRIS